jgi:hypothetical protein
MQQCPASGGSESLTRYRYRLLQLPMSTFHRTSLGDLERKRKRLIFLLSILRYSAQLTNREPTLFTRACNSMAQVVLGRQARYGRTRRPAMEKTRWMRAR